MRRSAATAVRQVGLRATLVFVLAWASAACGLRWTDPHQGSTWPLLGAHVAVACADCHTGAAHLPTTCQGCHEADRPLPHYAGECAECHDEQGWGTFAHDTFPLDGAHAVECLDCHVNGNLDLDTSCASCHEGARPTQHFTGGCEGCHRPTTWQDASIAHDFFPLEQAHAVACTACHTNGTYEGLVSTCASCHEGARPHPHYTGDCVGCHVPTVWDDAVFVHPTLPLAAAHDLPCASCHVNGTYEGLDATCSSCHEDDRPPAHFVGQDCGGACHPATTWADGHFNHAFFPVTGAHDVACTACHTNGTYEGLVSTCASCHEDERPADHFSGQDCGGACHPATLWADGHFDHTMFPLTSSHDVACDACHTNGTFQGLDSACSSCHEPDRPTAHFLGQDCAACHEVATWDFDHQPLFPIPHRGVSACNDCHLGGDVSDFSCIACHEHRQSEADSEHREVRNYQYNSDACLHCHPDGRN